MATLVLQYENPIKLANTCTARKKDPLTTEI